MDEILACCDSRCDICPRYQATINGDKKRLAELAELWHRCGWRERVLPAEEMVCYGCVKTTWCRYDILSCASGKKVANCGVCKQYSSCKRLEEMFSRNHLYAEKCKSVCSKEEYEMLQQTCFSKKKNLDKARRISSKTRLK